MLLKEKYALDFYSFLSMKKDNKECYLFFRNTRSSSFNCMIPISDIV